MRHPTPSNPTASTFIGWRIEQLVDVVEEAKQHKHTFHVPTCQLATEWFANIVPIN